MTTVNMSSSDNTSVRYYLPCYEHAQASFASAAASAAHKAAVRAPGREGTYQRVTLTALT